MHDDVLRFWFEEIDSRLWFAVDADFDALIRERFLGVLQQAAAGELQDWRGSAAGRLAEVIVLDQFSRNVYRGTPAAFAQDPMALVLAQEAVAASALTTLNQAQNGFLLLPYMHSESRKIHSAAEPLFLEFSSPQTQAFELKHKLIIDRFGRYPHRNTILGRPSTAEELAFLAQPGSGF